MEIKLYRETFLLIERAILQRKLANIHSANKVILINCTECAKEMATIYCVQCEDHFCKSCFDIYHEQAPAFQKHEKNYLLVNPTGAIPAHA